MSASRVTADTAFRVAERLEKVEGPWDVYAERSRSHELHFGGRGIEFVRGPIVLEGYGIRLLLPREGKTAIGFQASTDASAKGVEAVLRDAEGVSKYSEFPAKDVTLPSGVNGTPPGPEIVDRSVWENAPAALTEYCATLFAAFEGKKDVAISFGSVKAHRTEVTIANSAGLASSYANTAIEAEIAVKSSGGPEGTAPGEYWVNLSGRRLEPQDLPRQAEEWGRYASDARRAKSPPSGDLTVVLPPSILEPILPAALGFKLSGRGQLRELSPAVGSVVGPSDLTLVDDGTIDWATGSSPVDDEGTPQRRRNLIQGGKVSELLYDALYGSALSHPSSGSGLRHGFDFAAHRFARVPGPFTTTLSIPPGQGGSDQELIEAAGDGIWAQQIGWPSPDGLTTAFGGEIRIGYRIRNGKLAEPIRGGTIGGLVLAPAGTPSLLSNIVATGSHPVLSGGVLVPSLLIRPLTVAGDERAAAMGGA